MRSSLSMILVAALLALSIAATARADALPRLTTARLQATRDAIHALQGKRQEISRPGPYQDYRAVIHLHSKFSHDSRGTIEEILAAAKDTGTKVLMFSEHPSKDYDPVVNGFRGLKDGVLCIPGLETEGFLVFPTESFKGVGGRTQQFADQALGKGSLLFLSHLEERLDWQIKGLTGTEIYNTHAQLLLDKNLRKSVSNPVWMFKSIGLFQKFPLEAFGALQDYPELYIKKWDALCQKSPSTGVAANDSHQNTGFVVKLLADDKVRLEDALGEKIMEAKLTSVKPLQPMAVGKKPGDTILALQLDPYPVSMRHTGTHLLMKELTEKAVRETLEAGRAYVSFDWLADATGFDFAALSGSERHEMGSRLPYAEGLCLRAHAPLPAKWRLMRNGTVATESDGPAMEAAVKEPGIYRVEAWLEIAGEKKIWILSNPIYIAAANAAAAQ
jgi:hypothetical protein